MFLEEYTLNSRGYQYVCIFFIIHVFPLFFFGNEHVSRSQSEKKVFKKINERNW